MANKNVNVVDTVNNAFVDLLKTVGAKKANGVSVTETKDGKLVQSKEYTLACPVGNRKTLKTFDAEVIASTEKIALALYGKNVLTFAICKELANLNKQDKLDAMGFKNIGEYAGAMFDIARNTANQYARIGAIFINDEYKIASDILPSSLQKGHLLEFLKFIDESGDISHIEELYLDGTLTDGMPTKAIRNIMTQWKQGTLAIETTANELPDTDDSKANDDSVETTETTVTYQGASQSSSMDSQVEVGKILNACNEILLAFEAINKGGVSVIGYEKQIDAIKALASSLIK